MDSVSHLRRWDNVGQEPLWLQEILARLLMRFAISSLQSYLIHEDLHPGNLLYNVDGRFATLRILDAGLVRELKVEETRAAVQLAQHLPSIAHTDSAGSVLLSALDCDVTIELQEACDEAAERLRLPGSGILSWAMEMRRLTRKYPGIRLKSELRKLQSSFVALEASLSLLRCEARLAGVRELSHFQQVD